MQQYTYSIIIPHKNIPDLLKRCLDSIPRRDDVQVIIVDDNSDPDKVDFEHFPGLNRPNTEVYFDKTGRGAGRARNVGLEHAKGEWVLFSDCDDYYNKDNLNELFGKHISGYCKLVIWGIQHLKFDGTIWEDFVETGNELKIIQNKKVFLNRFSPWRAMVKLEVIKRNNITFEEIPASNDVMFHTRLMGVVETEEIMWFPKIIYTWEQRKESISHQPSLKKSLSRFRASLRSNKYAIKQGWGNIDSTSLYLDEIRILSKWHFFVGFYWECYYLGWMRASEDFQIICKKHSDRIMLYSNPVIVAQLVKKKLYSLLTIFAS